MSDSKVLVIGLPFTGKTTFLAALWAVVSSGEVPGSLTLEKLEGDKQYLNEIRATWADVQKLDRTKIADERVVSMRLKDEASGRCGEILFRDMSGESFEQQWTHRIWSQDYATLVQEAGGAILFVHPRQVKDTVLIAKKDAAAAIIRGSATEEPAPAESSGGKLPQYPTYSSTQIHLVEALQFILRERERSHLRLSVVVSAWDLIETAYGKGKVTPEQWLASSLPLLDQFIRANHESISLSVFGVSAQGGELSEAKELRKTMRAVDRIEVVPTSGGSNDITLPVRWATGMD